MKLKKTLFIKIFIYLMALRSPLILVSMFCYMAATRDVIKKFIINTLPFGMFLVVAILYSLSNMNSVENVLGESRDILLSVFVAVFLISCCDISDDNRKLIYKTLKATFVFIAIMKVLILIFSVATGVPMPLIISWIRDSWNIQMMSLGVEGTFLARLQIPLDSAVPFFLYFVTKELILVNKNKLRIISAFILLLVSMLLTLSRAFWAETILFVGLAILFEAGVVRAFKIALVSIISTTVLLLLTPLGTLIFKLIDTRFGKTSLANSASDLERVWQNQMLYNSFIDSPVFGHGLGYFIPNAMRSVTTPYLYESQSLSMLMTLGVVGTAVLLLLYVFLCIKTIYIDTNGRVKIIVPAVFLIMWIFSGSVNPLLFGASGGVIIFLTAKTSSLYKKTDAITV
ncbi:TPA: O-antigen ligase domain-containing protein [Klebsiella michiganensis]|uniref:O-antigen ligase family protein n=2 Tax=Klebsiella michiganensis TaxID=1134687 RepID=UPI000C9B80D1|nr:O-antigen ligase family protein [Klebsiella michiganensis]MBA7858588.1 O-antigen ligase domain-containing protein [Klebsiella michiganensis]MBG2644918.1 O-antigen ligase domain-containing protein [Klebsiella michiganensis]MBL0770490.1 O-antigen ligase domain-containing protein [Klebsiella michiganensis]MBX4801121.1 O-antigen ligase domain-containing protein [Klebsiella michiganensis]HDX8784854.1 O-antigen ligase domain-containing protein [Klebsiella michiganensis]